MTDLHHCTDSQIPMKKGIYHYLHHLRHGEPQRVTLHSILVDQEVSVLTDLFCNSRGTGKTRCKAHGWSHIKTANIQDTEFSITG